MRAYRVEQVGHCSACGRTNAFEVVAPTGVALGITFSDAAAAEMLADDLSTAYELGQLSRDVAAALARE